MRLAERRTVLAWALYDWANSAFATTVMAGFFPIFFKEYWNAGTPDAVVSFRLGLANSLSSIAIAGLAPLLGAIADRGSARKLFLLLFAALGVVATCGLYAVSQGNWPVAFALYVMGGIGFAGSLVFYDALLVSVAARERLDSVSALGYSLGYLGGGLLFTLNVAMVLSPGTFGLAGAGEAVRLSFVSVAGWWAMFSVPLFLWVPEPRAQTPLRTGATLGEGFRQLVATFRQIRRLRTVFLFLMGYWLYIDGVDTVIRMAADYGMNLGFSRDNLLLALLITQFVGFPAAIAFGRIGEKAGTKVGIFIGLGVYVGVTIWGYFMDQVAEFYVLAVTVGLVQGGVQSLSRSLFARLIPRDKTAEFFGFYNMLGKFAAVLGPVLMTGVGLLTGNPRLSILSVALLFLLGGGILYRVDERDSRTG